MLKTGDASGSVVYEGTGTPEGVVTANIGDLFCRTDGSTGTTLYVKQANGGGNTGWSPLGGSSTPTGNPTSMAYFVTGTGLLTSNAALLVDQMDSFARPCIWDFRVNGGNGCLYRQGQWQSDGDPSNIQGEGAVYIGQNINGNLSAADGAYLRLKKDRVGMYQIVTGNPIGDNPAGGSVSSGYIYRVDAGYLWLADNTPYNPLAVGANITFCVNRVSGYSFAKSQHIAAAYTTTDPGAGNQQVDGDTILSSTSRIYLGDPATTGTWRMVRSGNDLAFERYDGANWIQKGAITN